MAIWGAGIMVGPILGPVLGGWLTEHASWRWVFYINLPVGVMAFYGIARYLPESRPAAVRLDVFGFASLSLAIGLLQMFLDRGELLDWFNSTEICIEGVGALVAFAFFAVHTWTVQGESFFNRALLHDRNFLTGLLFAFIVGMVLYATMALLPALLQGLLGYPVVYTGEVMAPRGVGTMVAMVAVGRLVQHVEARKIMAAGFALTAFSLWQMTQLTLDMGSTLIITSGFIQGLGIGFTFVPLSAATFATLAPRLRNEGTPIFSLLRNIGSSVGISVVQTMLTRGTARSHAELAIDISHSNLALQALPPGLGVDSPMGLALLNNEVTRQAAMMSYVHVFEAMMVMTVLAMPLLLLVRKPATADSTAAMADAPH
jgi:DHA2 family multidrug resistance protein